MIPRATTATPPTRRRQPGRLLFALALGVLTPGLAGADAASVEDAIRAAWRVHPGLAASAEQVEAARQDAAGARDARLPTLAVTARGVVTDEPMMAFGLKLNEQRITQADFQPARLNSPSFIGGVGLGAGLVQPIYAGGRISAGARAAAAQADAEAKRDERERQQAGLSVVEAYFSAQAAETGVRHAEDQLQHARETERFMAERNRQGLALDADLARATAYRAQAVAELAAARQRLASARSALALLAGEEIGRADLTTPIGPAAPAPPAATPGPAAERADRPDLQAARLRLDAAREAATAARGNLLPQVSVQAGVETMRSDFDQGATWFQAALVARWQLGVPDLRATRAAQARSRAAADALRWQERQADREVAEARRAVEAADARVASAQEAVAASESARDLRAARHRQGLLPLTDVLDAEAGLAGARALLLRSQLEARVARAQLALSLGQPIEGVRS